MSDNPNSLGTTIKSCAYTFIVFGILGILFFPFWILGLIIIGVLISGYYAGKKNNEKYNIKP